MTKTYGAAGWVGVGWEGAGDERRGYPTEISGMDITPDHAAALQSAASSWVRPSKDNTGSSS